MKKIFTTLLFLSVTVACYSQAAQVLWFASPSGNDATGNGTLANPYKTITKAAQQLTAGDTLYIRGGTYTNATFGNSDPWRQETTARISNKDGAPGNYIVVMPYNNEQVIIKSDGQFGFQINGSSYIKVQGLELYGEGENITMAAALQYQFAFRRNVNSPAAYPGLGYENRLPPGTNTDQTGLEDISALTIFRPFYYFTHGLVVQGSHHIDVVNNKSHHFPGEGIRFAGCDYINATGNTIYENSHKSSNGGHGMSCYTLNSIDANNGVKILIARNKVYSNYCEVASWSELKTIFTATIDEGKGLTIQRSTAAGNWNNGRIRFENNICYDNGLSGIHVNEGDRVDIVNNTLYLNNHTGDGNNLGISVDGDDIKIYNNIVQSNLGWGGFTISATGATTNLIVSNNLVNGNLDADVNAVDVNTIFGTAQFVNAAANNFHLLGTSLGINNALASVAPAVDYDLLNRGSQPDCGALEYFTALPLTLISFNGYLQNDEVVLHWQTASETNTSHFEVEKLINNSWVNIADVSAKGIAADYSSMDNNIFNGTHIYRLKMIDKNGSFSYSKTIAIEVKQKASIQVYPNPFVNNIIIKNVKSSDVIKMIAVNGADVSNSVTIKKGNNRATISANNLPNGNYFIIINNQSYKITKAQ